MIELIKISKSFNGKTFFEDFNLCIPDGGSILLNGPSGTGKTSLLKMLIGFISPDKGDIIINDKKLNQENIGYIRNQIAYLSQDIDLPFEKTKFLIDEISNYKNNKGNNQFKSFFNEFSEYLQLGSDLIDKNIRELSGGERQRLGLAICLSLNRPILLLDEPTSSLDKEMKNAVLNLISSTSKTIIINSHDGYVSVTLSD